MTSAELQIKYDAAEEKVEKRKNIIIKACKKAGVNPDDVFNAYYSFVKDYKATYLRHRDAEAILDGVVDFHDKRYDAPEFQIYESIPKLYDVEKVANNWKVKLDIEKNKESVPKIQVLVDFLDEWGERAKKFYKNEASRYVDLLNEAHEGLYDLAIKYNVPEMSYRKKSEFFKTFNEYAKEIYDVKPRYSFRAIDAEDIADRMVEKLVIELARVRFHYNHIGDCDYYFGYNLDDGYYEMVDFNEKQLDKIIVDEKKRKYEDLCNRISAVVGEITDVRGLSIGYKSGELNGVVIGTKGKAKVETIGAGGYNIQCFHYRVLVKKLS